MLGSWDEKKVTARPPPQEWTVGVRGHRGVLAGNLELTRPWEVGEPCLGGWGGKRKPWGEGAGPVGMEWEGGWASGDGVGEGAGGLGPL